MSTSTFALAQIAATNSLEDNKERIRKAVRAAVARGAHVVLFPEACIRPFGLTETPIPQDLCLSFADFVRECAQKAQVILVLGLFTPGPSGKVYNTLLVTGCGLDCVYHKRYLFDAYATQESSQTQAGDQAVLVHIPPFSVGLALCYDIRFPAHFLSLAQAGANLFFVAADWARGGGKLEQWRLLARARALDTTSWLLACGQARHPSNPAFGLGHSLLVAPDGTIVQELGEDEDLLIAHLSPTPVEDLRHTLPVLQHQQSPAPIRQIGFFKDPM